MTTTNTQAKATLTPDAANTFPIPNSSATLVIRPNLDGSTAVAAWEGSNRVDAWTALYATQDEALAEARRAYRAFATHGCAAGIDRRRDALAVELNAQHARMARRMHSADRIDAIEAELRDLESFGYRALAQQLIASFAA